MNNKPEVYYQGNNLILDNFRRLDGYGFRKGFGSKLLKTKQDKGHHKQFELLPQRWKEGGEPLIPFDEIVNTTRATFAAIESLKQTIKVKPRDFTAEGAKSAKKIYSLRPLRSLR